MRYWAMPEEIPESEDFSIRAQFSFHGWTEVVLGASLPGGEEDGIADSPSLTIAIDNTFLSNANLLQVRTFNASCNIEECSSSPSCFVGANPYGSGSVCVRDGATTQVQDVLGIMSGISTWTVERRGGVLNVTGAYNGELLSGLVDFPYTGVVRSIGFFRWGGRLDLYTVCAKHGAGIWDAGIATTVAPTTVVRTVDCVRDRPCADVVALTSGVAVDSLCTHTGGEEYSCSCGPGAVLTTHGSDHPNEKLRGLPACAPDACFASNGLRTWEVEDLSPPCGNDHDVSNFDDGIGMEQLSLTCTSLATPGTVPSLTTGAEMSSTSPLYDCSCPYPYVRALWPTTETNPVRRGQARCVLRTSACQPDGPAGPCGAAAAGVCIPQWFNPTFPYRCECSTGYGFLFERTARTKRKKFTKKSNLKMTTLKRLTTAVPGGYEKSSPAPPPSPTPPAPPPSPPSQPPPPSPPLKPPPIKFC